MGLDQYLHAENYISGNSQKELLGEALRLVNAESFVDDYVPSASISVRVGYWRKANQVHQWFVDNVQGGEDNCGRYHVSREQLRELLETCKQVRASKHPDVANDLLPPQVGFFFGSYEIDEWYWEQLDSTIVLLGRLLASVPEEWDFYYSSSL
jgi:hypothetical protein